jgi:hypothetical protein
MVKILVLLVGLAITIAFIYKVFSCIRSLLFLILGVSLEFVVLQVWMDPTSSIVIPFASTLLRYVIPALTFYFVIASCPDNDLR